MEENRKTISATQAAKLLETTTANIYQMGKSGILSSLVISTGKRKNRYFFEDEILARKEKIQKIVILTDDTDTHLASAVKLNREAQKNEDKAKARLKASRNWMKATERISDMADVLLSMMSEMYNLSSKESEIIRSIVRLETLEDIAHRNQCTVGVVNDVAIAAVKKLRGAIFVMAEFTAMKEKVDRMMTQISTLREKERYYREKYEMTAEYQLQQIKNEEGQSIDLTQEEQVIRERLMEIVPAVSVRLTNSLRAYGIETFADICLLNKKQVANIHNLGRKTLKELDDLLEKKGLSYDMDITKFGIVPSEHVLRNFSVDLTQYI